MDDPWQFVGLVGLSIITGLCGLWLYLHRRQAERIDKLNETNNKAHKDIHKKIDALDEKSAERHNIVRDKIEQVWLHLVNKK